MRILPLKPITSYRITRKPIFWRLRPAERRTILLIGDLLVTLIALFIALYFWAYRDNWLDFSWEFLKNRPYFWFYLMPLMWIMLMTELYDVRRASRSKETLIGIITAAGVGVGIYFVLFFFAAKGTLPRFSVGTFILSVFFLTLLWRLAYINVFTAPQFMRRVLVIGAGRSGIVLAQVVKNSWPPPFYLAGYIDDDLDKRGQTFEDRPVLGGSQNLLTAVKEQNITDLVFAISGDMNPEMFKVLMQAEEQGVEITTMPIVYEELLGRVPIFLLQSDWLLRSFVDQAHAGQLFELAKRAMDLAGGLIGTLVLLALFPFLSLLIMLDDGFPIIHSQKRIGRSGRAYTIIKFRTMCKDAEKDGKPRLAQENDDRVTRIGRLLRKSHLDELPQFLNVLAGEMSLVGPRSERPELVDELQECIPFYRARLLVKPGLTGWAQINQSYAANIEEMGIKLEYDLYYIKHRNLMLDITILLQTFGQVFGFRGQ